MTTMTPTAQTVVLHSVPGRLRVRVAAHADTAALEMVLRQQRGVESCRRSAQSLLIRYRSAETTADRLLKVVASSLIPGENVPISRMIIEALASINATITRATGDNFDIRTLLALALAAWAGRQIIRGEGPQGGRAVVDGPVVCVWTLSPPRRQRDRFGDGPAHVVGPPHALGPTSVGGKGAGGLSHCGPLAFRVARVIT